MQELSAFQKAVVALKKSCTEMLAVKKKAADGAVARADLAPLATTGALRLAAVKRTSREVMLRGEEFRGTVATTQGDAEHDNLQLENLRYEDDNLRREITRCQSFRTAEMDRVDLMPDGEFITSAPSDLTKVSKADNPHAHHMNRLAHELQLRQRISKDLEKMVATKSDVQDETADKTRFLEGLPSHLKAMEKATAPLQKFFSLRTSKVLKQHSKSSQLEGPLYVLYRQLEALEDDDKQPLMVTIHARSAGDDDARGTSLNATARKRGRRDDDDDDDDAPPAAKRRDAGAGAGAGAGAAGGRSDDDDDGTDVADLLEPAQLTVHLTLTKPESVTLEFAFLPKLRVVTVEILNRPPALLACLMPGDTGEHTPRLSNHHLLAKLDPEGGSLFPASSAARPYHWAQWLAGLYLLPPPAPDGAARHIEPSTRRILDLLRTRIACRSELHKQLGKLAAVSPDVSVHPDCRDLFPPQGTAPYADLKSWEELLGHQAASVQRCFKPPGTLATSTVTASASVPVEVGGSLEVKGPLAADDELVPDPGTNGAASPADAGAGAGAGVGVGAGAGGAVDDPQPSFHFGTRFFRGVLAFGERFLQVLVAVPPDYPVRPPQYRLAKIHAATTPLVDRSFARRMTGPLENLQHDLNALAPVELVSTPASAPWLLSHQLQRLRVMFPKVIAGRFADHKTGRVRRGRDRTPALLYQRSKFVYR